jgi:lysophospholipase L1-like esterase
MKKIFLIFMFSMIGFLLNAQSRISARNALIEYTGRIDFSNPEAPSFAYSGVSIRACFDGGLIIAILEDEKGENFYNVILDGEVLRTIHTAKGKHAYVLAEGLTGTNHEIELFKRTEVSFGKTTFRGFELESGATLKPLLTKQDRLIEFIGNSITCGYGNEGLNGDTFGQETENHYLTYAAITARNLYARHISVSKSGIGVYRNYDGPAEGNSDCMTNRYDRIFLYEDFPKYDFARQPDVFCINLGTNDFSTIGGDSVLYVDNYLRLLDIIQSKYHQPQIVCLLGPMMNGDVLNEVRGYLKYIVDTANDKGRGSVTFFEMSPQTGDLGIGIDSHPTVAQHQKNAAELTAYLSDLMGWEVVEDDFSQD